MPDRDAKIASPTRSTLPVPGHMRRGGALVEGALVMSILVALSIGGAEFGYAFYLKHAMQAAAAMGVRTAILPTSSDTAVLTAVTAELSNEGLSNIPFTLTTNPSTVNNCPTGTFVTCTVSATWGTTGVSPLPVSMGGFAATKQFSCSETMVHE